MNPLSNPFTAVTDRPCYDAVIAPAGAACPCHDVLDCPDRATVAIPAADLADLACLLGVVDEFLRCGNGVAQKLADFFARRGQGHPVFTVNNRIDANNLIDQVSFTAATLRRQDRQHRDGDPR